VRAGALVRVVDDLIVTPVVHALPPVRLGGDWSGGGDAASRSVAVSGSDDAATREYRYGDDLRKVHWKSTARTGELMVRREEQPFQSRATLLLDGRLEAHRGDGPGSSFEWAVSAVASVGVALARSGFSLALLRENGTAVAPVGVPLTEGLLLDELATVRTVERRTLDAALEVLRGGGLGGVLVAVVGAMDLEQAERLARLRTGTSVCVAVLLDTHSWAPGPARSRALTADTHERVQTLLSGAGWRVLPASAGSSLAELWPLAGGRLGSGPMSPSLAAAAPASAGALARRTPARWTPARWTPAGRTPARWIPPRDLRSSSVTTRDRLALAAALAVALATASLRPVYADLGWLLPVLGAVVVVVGASTLARAGGAPRAAQPLAGVVALLAYVTLVFAGSTLAYGLLPTPTTVSSLSSLVRGGLQDVQVLAPPVPTTSRLVVLAVLGTGAIAVAVDLLAVVLRKAALSGLPLLLLFAVPSAVLRGGLGAFPFVLGAAGWLALLLADSGDRATRWGTPLRSARAPELDPSLGRVGRRIGAAALGVAVVVPVLVPGLDGRLLGGGGGGEGGDGSRTTVTYNPLLSLAGQLRQDGSQDAVHLPLAQGPDYLRLTTLDVFDRDSGWSSSELSADVRDDAVQDTLPVPTGRSAPTEAVQVEVDLTGRLGGPWLPVPATPSLVDIDGAWLWDREAETVFSTRTSVRDIEEPYTVRAARLRPDVALLRRNQSVPPVIAEPYAVVPELSDEARRLLDRTVAGATTDFDKVAAIQRLFRETDFEYTEETVAPPPDAPDALTAFLQTKQGFCEQYASAMAALVRGLGIPARVAVGFTAGTPTGDDATGSPTGRRTPGPRSGSAAPAGCASSRPPAPTRSRTSRTTASRCRRPIPARTRPLRTRRRPTRLREQPAPTPARRTAVSARAWTARPAARRTTAGRRGCSRSPQRSCWPRCRPPSRWPGAAAGGAPPTPSWPGRRCTTTPSTSATSGGPPTRPAPRPRTWRRPATCRRRPSRGCTASPEPPSAPATPGRRVRWTSARSSGTPPPCARPCRREPPPVSAGPRAWPRPRPCSGPHTGSGLPSPTCSTASTCWSPRSAPACATRGRARPVAPAEGRPQVEVQTGRRLDPVVLPVDRPVDVRVAVRAEGRSSVRTGTRRRTAGEMHRGAQPAGPPRRRTAGEALVPAG
jgi:transglutaminase-like putative cysteine protease